MWERIAFFAAVVAADLIGGMVPLYVTLVRHRPSIALNFSSGILLGASFLMLIPETFQILNQAAGLPILCGFLVLFIMEKFFLVDPCDEVECAVHAIGIPAFVGMSLHSLADGLALGASLFVPQIGIVVLLALIFHKIPSSFSLSTILLSAKYSRKQTILFIFLMSLMTPLGAALALYGLHSLHGQFAGWATGIAAGTFLAIGTGDLFVQVHTPDERRHLTLSALMGGIVVAWLGTWLA